MSIISFDNYFWKYTQTDKPALENINLEIEEGTFIGIIGPNGAGKTTLVYSINGLIPNQYYGVRRGNVNLLGKKVIDYRPEELAKIVGAVFSDPESQFTSMTVEDEVVFGMENIGLSVSEIQKRLDWVVPLTKIGPLMDKPPYEVSGGQKARVALAAVLAMTPKIIVLDEPTSMLDPISRKQVFEVLLKLKDELKSTIIVVEHSLENLVPMADKMLLVYNSHVALADYTEPFFEKIDFLLKHDVFPPEIIQFFYELFKLGGYKGKLPLSLDEAVNYLRKLMKNRKFNQ